MKWFSQTKAAFLLLLPVSLQSGYYDHATFFGSRFKIFLKAATRAHYFKTYCMSGLSLAGDASMQG